MAVAHKGSISMGLVLIPVDLMAKMLVDNMMTKPFVPEDFRDEYQARLRDAITKKDPMAGNCYRRYQ